MKRIIISILFRILLTFLLIYLAISLKYSAIYIYTFYICISFLLFGFFILNPYNSFDLNKKMRKLQIFAVKFALSAFELICFLVFQRNIGTVKAIIFTQIVIHPTQSFALSKFFFRLETMLNKWVLYPLPLLKEVRWQVTKQVGAIFQTYFPASVFTQKSLINTSYFFRDLIDYDKLLINYAKNKKNNFINILIAGCATGQETYSVAIFCEANNIDYEITAVDISDSAISKATCGRYNFSKESELMMRSGKLQSLEDLNKYSDFYLKENGDILIKDFIKNKITFRLSDIAEIKYTNKFDFVFARKFLYYLPKSKLDEVYARLKQALKNTLPDENLIIDGYSKRILKKYLN